MNNMSCIAKRHWCQFSVRTVLVVVLALTFPLKWFVARTERATRQRKAVEDVERCGGIVTYQYELPTERNLVPGAKPPGSVWLWKSFGVDFVSDVVAIEFVHKVADADMVHLRNLTAIRDLSLWGTGVTDSGLENLKGLTALENLCLRQTAITDVGLERVKTLVNLRLLNLEGTKVTDEGVRKLQRVIPDCEITFGHG